MELWRERRGREEGERTAEVMAWAEVPTYFLLSPWGGCWAQYIAEWKRQLIRSYNRDHGHCLQFTRNHKGVAFYSFVVILLFIWDLGPALPMLGWHRWARGALLCKFRRVNLVICSSGFHFLDTMAINWGHKGEKVPVLCKHQESQAQGFRGPRGASTPVDWEVLAG